MAHIIAPHRVYLNVRDEYLDGHALEDKLSDLWFVEVPYEPDAIERLDAIVDLMHGAFGLTEQPVTIAYLIQVPSQHFVVFSLQFNQPLLLNAIETILKPLTFDKRWYLPYEHRNILDFIGLFIDDPSTYEHLDATCVADDYHRERILIQTMFSGFQFREIPVNEIGHTDSKEEQDFFKQYFQRGTQRDMAKLLEYIVQENVRIFPGGVELCWSAGSRIWYNFDADYYFHRIADIIADNVTIYAGHYDDRGGRKEFKIQQIKEKLSEEGRPPTKEEKETILKLEKEARFLKFRQGKFDALATKLGGHGFIDGICKFLRKSLMIRDEAVRKRIMEAFSLPKGLPLKGGSYFDHQTGTVQRREMKHYFMSTINCDFTYDARKSKEENFSWAPQLIRSLAGLDEETTKKMGIVLYMCTLGINAERAFVVVFGEGSNGKTLLFVHILGQILGRLHGMMPDSMLMSNEAKSAHTGFKSQMAGVFAGVRDDPKESSIFDMGCMKNLGNINGGEWVRDSGAHGNGWWMLYTFLPIIMLNLKKFRTNEPLDKASRNRLVTLMMNCAFLTPKEFDGLGDEVKASGKYIREIPREQIYDPTFLQGMLNYILVQGRADYLERKALGERAVTLDEDLLNEIVRDVGSDITEWFNTVTVTSDDPHAKVSLNSLRDIYEKEMGEKMEPLKFMNLIRKYCAPKADPHALFRTTDEKRKLANQYHLRGFILRDESMMVLSSEAVQLDTLDRWFLRYYQEQDGAFPFLDEIREGYNTYLKANNLSIQEQVSGFAAKLQNYFSFMRVSKKQGKIDGVLSHKLRVWNFSKRAQPLDNFQLEVEWRMKSSMGKAKVEEENRSQHSYAASSNSHEVDDAQMRVIARSLYNIN